MIAWAGAVRLALGLAGVERQAGNRPEIVLNLFCHGPIERGLDASAGGWLAGLSVASR